MVHDGRDGLGQPSQGSAAPGDAGVAAFALYGEAQIRVAFFHQVDGGDLHAGSPVDHAVVDAGPAFIQDEGQPGAMGLQQVGDGFCAFAPGLFVLSEGQDDGPRRPLSAGEQVFRRLQLAEDHLLDVQGAPAPDVALLHRAGKSGPGPVPFGALHHGDHVLMGHEQGGRKLELSPRDRDQHAAAHRLKMAGGHEGGIALPHQIVQFVKRSGILAAADGPALDRLGEPPYGAFRVQIGEIFFMIERLIDVVHGSPPNVMILCNTPGKALSMACGTPQEWLTGGLQNDNLEGTKEKRLI